MHTCLKGESEGLEGGLGLGRVRRVEAHVGGQERAEVHEPAPRSDASAREAARRSVREEGGSAPLELLVGRGAGLGHRLGHVEDERHQRAVRRERLRAAGARCVVGVLGLGDVEVELTPYGVVLLRLRAAPHRALRRLPH